MTEAPPLSPGHWLIFAGPAGLGYGIGEVTRVRPVNIDLDPDTSTGWARSIRRGAICEVMGSREEAEGVLAALDALAARYPFGVFPPGDAVAAYRERVREARGRA